MDILYTMSLPDNLSSEAVAPLARRAREGDADAFTRLVDAYHARVYRYLHALVRHPEDASDLTQDVFIKVYQGLKRFNPDRPLEPWLFTIARRTAMSYFRRLRRDEPYTEETIVQLDASHEPDTDRAEQARSVWELAHHLPPRLHQVLLLHYREGFPVTEVARIMGITGIHTRVLLHRARTQLRNLHLEEEERQNANSETDL